ncbi:MAG: L,D-transpeptidase family protein [Planctomycetes bacterium]|nr:L,D-transpeptidase family protein [Planctomycetota bacterium]MCW8136440.1 L,D-transpeptidase family protein [Planctomycetota bacterium]
MNRFAFILFLCAVITGCTLTGVRSGSVAKDTEPAHADALGDPTFEHETVDSQPVAGYERKVPEDAVVDTHKTAPKIERQPNADMVAGMKCHDEGRLREARVFLTKALDGDLSTDEEATTLATLRGINEKIFLSAGADGDLKTYTVEKGDFPARIAGKVGTTWEMIVRLNGLSEKDIKTLQIGRELKVPAGEFSLVVRKSRFVMDLLLDGAFIQRYEVGLGVGGCTPLGEFTVKNRIPKPADGSYPYGHEKHRLGTRWLGLQAGAEYKGYGIHGCKPEEEAQIPGECSQGCVRMRNADVEEIYDIVPSGARVVIQEK